MAALAISVARLCAAHELANRVDDQRRLVEIHPVAAAGRDDLPSARGRRGEALLFAQRRSLPGSLVG